MRLSVLNYPLQDWTDAVVMNFCTGHAVAVQLEDMVKVSYQPLAEVLRAITPVEAHHTQLAEEGLARLLTKGGPASLAESLAYWRPRVVAIFGDPPSERAAQLQAWGLRHRSGAEMRQDWENRIKAGLSRLGL